MVPDNGNYIEDKNTISRRIIQILPYFSAVTPTNNDSKNPINL